MNPYPTSWRVGAVVIFLITTIFTASLALPFQPYQHLEFEELPVTMCTHEGLQVGVTRQIDDPALGTLEKANVKSWWQEADTGAMEAAGEVPIPLEGTDTELITSPVLREAPPKPGDYYLYSETTAYGTLGIVPRDTTVATYSDHTISVVDCEGRDES